MRKLIVATLVALMSATAHAQVLQRPLSFRGLSQGVTYFMFGTSLQEFQPSPSHGEIAIRHAPGGPPELVIWDAFSGGWKANSFISQLTLDGLQAPILNTGEVWGAVEITNLTNANHIGAGYMGGFVVDSNIVQDSNAFEGAFASLGTGWDYDFVIDHAARIAATAGGTFTLGIGGTTANFTSGILVNDFNNQPQLSLVRALQAGKNEGWMARASQPVDALDGSDVVGAFVWPAVTDVNHTGTDNSVNTVWSQEITTPDTNAIHSTIRQDAGWDALALAAASNTAWAAADDPPSGYIGFWVRQGIAATQNCSLMVRLSSGADVEVVALVANNVCP